MAGYDGGGYGPEPGYGGGYGGGYGPDPGYGGGGYGPEPGGYSGQPDHYDYDQGYGQDMHGMPPGMPVGQDFDQDNRSNKSYQQYTEPKGGSPNAIDAENGIAPRRCTDCVCLFIFLAYMLGMVILVSEARGSMIGERPWGDVKRLTHAHDYKGRLCGVDSEVLDKPFLYWCRLNANEWGASPSALNLDSPSCVAHCPTESDEQVACLQHQSVQPIAVPGGPFGTVETYHVEFQQALALTNPYSSRAFGGRFCVPENATMKGQILHGPLRVSARLYFGFGSLQDPWGVLFGAAAFSTFLGYVYIFAIKHNPTLVIMIFLYATWICFTAAGCFFIYALVGVVSESTGNAKMLVSSGFADYISYNPLYEMFSPHSAGIWSTIIGSILMVIACGVLGTISHVAGAGFHYVPDLIDAAAECWTAMPSMLIPPGVEAIFKYFLMYILSYNFMYLMSCGWYEDRRLLINSALWKDETVVFHFDFTVLPWLAYYIFGSVWLMELATSCGQFLVSFAVISWYFMKKDGHMKTGVPPMPPVFGTLDGVMFHAGSVCLGAAVIPWIRLIRIFNWIEDESVPDKDAACCPQDATGAIATALNKLCSCCGSICQRGTDARKQCCLPACCGTSPEPRTEGLLNAGCAYRYTKNAYNDVIIRSQHFLQASQRSFLLINKYDSTKIYILGGKGCQVVTAVGVTSIGLIGAAFTHMSIMSNASLTDPTSGAFIAEPLMVDFLAFVLCGSIAYGFMMLFDHTADTLLYCYAWNKKFAKDNNGASVEDYLPESLRDIVDADLDEDDGYCFYGQARPEMYLSTWLGSSRRKQMKDERLSGKERQSAIAMSSSAGSASATASQVPYQQVASSPGPMVGGTGYYDPSSPGGGGYGGYGGQP